MWNLEARVVSRQWQVWAPGESQVELELDDAGAYVGKVMNQWFGLTYVQVVVSMLVAILGIDAILDACARCISSSRCRIDGQRINPI